jgi:hypothetical protein
MVLYFNAKADCVCRTVLRLPDLWSTIAKAGCARKVVLGLGHSSKGWLYMCVKGCSWIAGSAAAES